MYENDVECHGCNCAGKCRSKDLVASVWRATDLKCNNMSIGRYSGQFHMVDTSNSNSGALRLMSNCPD